MLDLLLNFLINDVSMMLYNKILASKLTSKDYCYESDAIITRSLEDQCAWDYAEVLN